MEIVLVRHAQPDWEPGGRAVDNPDLTELGRAQAECVARELADETFDAIYVSPLERAAQTAAPLLGQRGIQGQTCSWLREMGMPVLDGQTSE
ncbi:MAG: histidine phosphatase family protein, partial [Myxococcota bacterium]